MVNKLFWHISDFVLASYTFGCVKMSDFVPNNRHFPEVLIFFFHCTCCDWFRHFKDGDFDVVDRPREYHNSSRGTKKWFYSMTKLGLTLPNSLKPTWKSSNGKSYPTHRIPQILRRLTITCSGRWHMVWLISSSVLLILLASSMQCYF